jgi:hypothetical protein
MRGQGGRHPEKHSSGHAATITVDFLITFQIFIENLKPTSARGSSMGITYRVLLAAGIVCLDLVVFFVPLTALFLGYILLVNPPWFREFLNDLDRQKQE